MSWRFARTVVQLVFFVLFSQLNISLAFLLSTLFKTTRTANAVAVLYLIGFALLVGTSLPRKTTGHTATRILFEPFPLALVSVWRQNNLLIALAAAR